jgi:Ca2+-binding EF-hand superfamily protein
LLEDIGVRIETGDLTWCFYCFNVSLDKYISLEEFASMIKLTDHELDLSLEKIQHRIFAAAGSNSKSTTRNKLRDNRMLSRVFKYMNTSQTGILGLEELLEFTAKLEIYLTDEEGHSILKLMDRNGNQRVEESEFIELMCKANMVLSNKAERLQNAANKLRLWLLRGSGSLTGSTGSMTPSKSSFSSRYNFMYYSKSFLILY